MREADLAYGPEEESPLCWMCDTTSARRASEHVFPRWLLSRIPARSLTAVEICETCNSGWMSGLEVVFRAAAFRRPRAGQISQTTQLIIARWFAKTAVMVGVAEQSGMLVPAPARHGLRSGLPDGFEVFLGRHAARVKKLEYRIGVGAEPAFVCGIRVGELIGVVVFQSPRVVKSAKPLLRIGPSQKRKIGWNDLPTVRAIDECVRYRSVARKHGRPA
jgi:hypothetical protein